jgi:hypothetical protein
VKQALQRMRIANPEGLTEGTGITVLVWAHVLMSTAGEGEVGREVLEQQVKVLNDSYSSHGFRFKLAEMDKTKKNDWFTMKLESSFENAAKEALSADPHSYLNLYTAKPSDGSLGWGAWPWKLSEAPKLDGVVVDYRTLPGGSKTNYNLGKTAVHEVGHWLGLSHTFEGGCEGAGDEVADTPPEAKASTKCPGETEPNRDTCPDRPGRDSIKNYMNYVYDRCMVEFTPGQVDRMLVMTARYRSSLLPKEELARLNMADSIPRVTPTDEVDPSTAMEIAELLAEQKKLSWGAPTKINLEKESFTIEFETPADEAKLIGPRSIIVEKTGEAELAPRR